MVNPFSFFLSLVSMVAAQSWLPSRSVVNTCSSSLTFLTAFIICFPKDSHCDGWGTPFKRSFNFHFPDSQLYGMLFKYVLAICISSLKKYLLSSSTHVLIRWFSSWYLISPVLKYILDVNHPSEVRLAKSPPTLPAAPPPLKVFFPLQSLLISCNPVYNQFLFFFFPCVIKVPFRILLLPRSWSVFSSIYKVLDLALSSLVCFELLLVLGESCGVKPSIHRHPSIQYILTMCWKVYLFSKLILTLIKTQMALAMISLFLSPSFSIALLARLHQHHAGFVPMVCNTIWGQVWWYLQHCSFCWRLLWPLGVCCVSV